MGLKCLFIRFPTAFFNERWGDDLMIGDMTFLPKYTFFLHSTLYLIDFHVLKLFYLFVANNNKNTFRRVGQHFTRLQFRKIIINVCYLLIFLTQTKYCVFLINKVATKQNIMGILQFKRIHFRCNLLLQ